MAEGETLAKLEEVIGELTTLEQVEEAKSKVVDIWKGLEEESMEAKGAATAYAKLLMQGNKLKALLPKTKSTLPVEAVAEAQQALDKALAEGMLAVTVGSIEPVVKAGHAQSLEEVLATIFAVQRQMIMAKYDQGLSGPGLIAFSMLLDQKIKTKIDTRLKGSKGEVYIKAYNDAVSKYGGTPVEAVPGAGPPKKKKATKKKVADLPSKSTWHDVSEALVTLAADKFMPALAGQTVIEISTGVEKLMAAYMDDERKRWTEQGVECSDLLLRHNYLTLLLDTYPTGEEVVLQLVPEKGVRISRKAEVFEEPVLIASVPAVNP